MDTIIKLAKRELTGRKLIFNFLFHGFHFGAFVLGA